MLSREIWLECCLVQLDACSHDYEDIKKMLIWFVDDNEWLRYAFQKSFNNGHFDLKETELISLTKEEIKYLEKIQGKGFPCAINSNTHVIKVDSYYMIEVIKNIKYPIDINISCNELLPDWFLVFFKNANVLQRYDIFEYIRFKKNYTPLVTGSTINPVEAVKNLVEKGFFELEYLDEPTDKQKIAEFAYAKFLEVADEQGHLKLPRIGSHEYQKLGISSNYAKKVVSQLRKAIGLYRKSCGD